MLRVLADLMRLEQQHADKFQPGSFDRLTCPADAFHTDSCIAKCARALWPAVHDGDEEKVLRKYAKLSLGDWDPWQRDSDKSEESDASAHERARANRRTMSALRTRFRFLPFFGRDKLVCIDRLECERGLQWLRALAKGEAAPIEESPGRALVKFRGFGSRDVAGWGVLAASYMGGMATAAQRAAMAANTLRFSSQGLARVRARVPELHDLLCDTEKLIGGGFVPLWADLVRQTDNSSTAFPQHRDIPLGAQGQGRAKPQRSLVSTVINVCGCGSGVDITGVETVTFGSPGDMCVFPSELWHESVPPAGGYGTEPGHLKFVVVFGEDLRMGLCLS